MFSGDAGCCYHYFSKLIYFWCTRCALSCLIVNFCTSSLEQ